jgi:hypothetical protein
MLQGMKQSCRKGVLPVLFSVGQSLRQKPQRVVDLPASLKSRREELY